MVETMDEVLKLALESPLPVIRSNRRSRSEGVIVELPEGPTTSPADKPQTVQ